MKDGMGEAEAVQEVERLKGEMSVAGFIDHLAKESRRGKTSNRGGGGGNTTIKRKRGEPEESEDSDVTSARAPAGIMKQGTKKPKRSVSRKDEEGEKQLGIQNESESEEKPMKRRTSLNLRGRQIMGREDLLGEDSPEEESDSEASWHDHWR